jgi:hypothetical protein
MASSELLLRDRANKHWTTEAGYRPRKATALEANCFLLTFSEQGSPMALSSVTGTDQFKSEGPKPMELAYLGRTNAILVPSRVTWPIMRGDKVEGIGFGTHKLDIQYQLNGQTYSCQFDVKYTVKSTHEFHTILELRGLN